MKEENEKDNPTENKTTDEQGIEGSHEKEKTPVQMIIVLNWEGSMNKMPKNFAIAYAW